jgi:hypothetical protein
MQAERLTRAFHADLEVRGDGRTIVGLAAPFEVPTEIRDHLGHYHETIAPGAFARTIAERGDRVKLLVQHQREILPIGRATVLREDPAGLYGEFRVSATDQGDQVLELVRDGALDGLSIGFRTVRDQWSHDRTRRRLIEARLDEVSVVPFAAYDDARVLAVRTATSPLLIAALQRLHERKRVPDDYYL